MTENIALQLSVLFLLILINGFFSMSELALLTAKKAVLREKAAAGSHGAHTALHLAEAPNKLLSTIQVGITLVGLLAGALGGVTFSGTLSRRLGTFLPAHLAAPVAFVLVMLAITYLTIVVGELVPKRLGMAYPERIAIRASRLLLWINRILRPLVFLLEASTGVLSRLFHLEHTGARVITEEEIRIFVEEGARVGSIEDMEKELMHQVLDLGDLSSDDIMTPKLSLIWLDIEDPPQVILETVLSERHSQYPVVKGGFESFIGIVSERDILREAMHRKDFSLAELSYRPVFVPETMEALTILSIFKEYACREAAVIDEYGDFVGLITRKDLLEKLVGAMREEDEPLYLEYLEDGTISAKGLLPLDELKRILLVEQLPNEERDNFHTLSGFVVSYLGTLPEPGDSVSVGDHRIIVQELEDGTRVQTALIAKLPEKELEKSDETKKQEN